MNIRNAIISIIFIVIGAFLIRYSLLRPCDIAPITQNVQGQEIVVEQPAELDRLICTSSDYISLITLLIGTAAVFPGVSGLYKSLLQEGVVSKKRKNK